jgi:ABC-2 type transport system ATP-binding protein
MAMIEVEHLTKRYGPLTAVQDVTFNVEKGEIVGFLGRNGAGKTTTMRILTGSLSATEGRAVVGGFDVFDRPKDVKRLIGYLPEAPPLYVDMTVRDYLRFCARIKQCEKPREAVDRVIEEVGLHDKSTRLIEHLSKGYKQRVGIAQALVHRPPVLILDEPVSGLDPAQRAEILDLIKVLAKGDTTVVLSTHVLAEIEPVCTRVIIVRRGQIVAQDTVDHLIESLGNPGRSISLRIARPGPEVVARIKAVPGVKSALESAGGRILVEGDVDVREAVSRVAVEAGLLEMRTEQGLQDIFLRLTEEAAA